MKPKHTPEIVLGVPGPWANHKQVVESIARDSGGYLFAGKILLHNDTHTKFELEVEGRLDDLAEVFAHASGGRISEAELKSIDQHQTCLYIVGEGGSAEAAHACAEAANGLLRAGGLAVKVDSAGVAHSKEAWFALGEEGNLIEMLVAFVGDEEGAVFSCGMHALGHPDAKVEGVEDSEEASDILFGFVDFLAGEEPELDPGDTFGLEEDGPAFTLAQQPSMFDNPEDPFHNPYGMWVLTPAG